MNEEKCSEFEENISAQFRQNHCPFIRSFFLFRLKVVYSQNIESRAILCRIVVSLVFSFHEKVVGFD